MIKNKIPKILFYSLILILFSSCSLVQDEKQKQEIVNDNEDKEFVIPYIDENPIELSLYQNNNGVRIRKTIIESPLTKYKDIISLEVYYTKEEVITGEQKELWKQYKSNYENIDNYKIGYHISFETEDLSINKTIINPIDTESFFDYIQIYLYDDINQENSRYSHITQDEITEKTILTSIKLTASTQIDSITSPITLTVFPYDKDKDFDEAGNYQGTNSTKVIINRK